MIKQITSPENPVYKTAHRLQRNGPHNGMCLIEGERFLLEALQHHFLLHTLFLQEKDAWIKEHPDTLKLFYTNNPCLQIVVLTRQLFKTLSINQTTPAVIAMVQEQKLQPSVATTGRILFLDHLQNPGNLGTIIRTALGLGFRQVLLYQCVNRLNTKVIQASAGNSLHQNVLEVGQDGLKVLQKFKADGIPRFATALGETSQDFRQIPWQNFPNLVLMIGNEGRGISEPVLKLADHYVQIPMLNHVDSLNVGVATGILCYFIMCDK